MNHALRVGFLNTSHHTFTTQERDKRIVTQKKSNEQERQVEIE